MTIHVLKIGDREVSVNLIEVPAEGEKAPTSNSSYNDPFQDEVCIKLENSNLEQPKYYVAQLHSSEKPQEIMEQLLSLVPKGTKSVEWVDDENYWVDDEKKHKQTYKISKLDIEFGWRTGPRKIVKAKQEDLDFNIEKEREKFRKYLGDIKAGDSINADQKRKIIDDYLPELQRIFPNEVIDTLYDITWAKVGKSIKILFILTPPTKVLRPIINIEGGGELPKWEQEKIATFFGLDLQQIQDMPIIDPLIRKTISFFYKQPLTRATLDRGVQRLIEYFKNHDKYTLAHKDPSRMFFYTDKKELNLHLTLLPHPKAFDLHIVELDDAGTLVRQAHLSPGSKLPIKIKQPLNEENIQKNFDNLLDAYGKQGFLATAISAIELSGGDPTVLDPSILESLVEGNLVYHITLKPNPINDVVIVGERAPDAKEVEKMFAPNGYYSTTSILNGLKKLHRWHAKNGYHLRPGEPKYRIDGDKLIVVAEPAKFEELSIYYHYKDKDGEGKKHKVKLEDVPDDVLSPTARHNIENELQHFRRKGAEDGFYHHDTLQRALWRLRSNYPHHVRFPDTVNLAHNLKTNKVSVTVNIYDDSIKGTDFTVAWKGRLGGTQIGEALAASGHTSARLRTKSGYNPGGRLGYFKSGPDHIGNVGASLQIPWINDRGLSANVGSSNTVVLYHEDGTPYDHVVGVYGRIDQPLRHSNDEWGYIAGLAAHGIIDPDDGYQKTWFKSDIAGIRYYTPKTLARITTGPRVSTNREIYWEMMFNASHRIDLVESGRYYLKLRGSAGARFGIDGDVPYDQLFRGFAFSTGYEGISEKQGTHFAGARIDLMHDIARYASVGIGSSSRIIRSHDEDLIVEGGAGLNVQLAKAVELLFGPRIRRVDGETQVDPFAFSLTLYKDF